MDPVAIYKKILSTKFTKSKNDLDWCAEVHDDEKAVRLIFQWTEDDTDWKVNFDFPVKIYKKQESCIKAAKGWADTYKMNKDEIMNKLIPLIEAHPDYKVEVWGYSYGAAMAAIAIEDVYYRTKIKPNLISFGAPKPLFGRKTIKYVRSCCNEIYEFCHKDDIVPLAPPFPGYGHLNMIKLCGKFPNIFNLFKPLTYHVNYDNPKWYEGVDF